MNSNSINPPIKRSQVAQNCRVSMVYGSVFYMEGNSQAGERRQSQTLRCLPQVGTTPKLGESLVGWLMEERAGWSRLSPGTLLHGLGKIIATRVPRNVKGPRSVCDPGTSNLGQDVLGGRNLMQLAGPSVLGPLTLDSVKDSIFSLPCLENISAFCSNTGLCMQLLQKQCRQIANMAPESCSGPAHVLIPALQQGSGKKLIGNYYYYYYYFEYGKWGSR